MNKISLVCDDPSFLTEAQHLAQSLTLPFNVPAQVELTWLKDKWAIVLSGAHPLWVEFNPAHWRKEKANKAEGLIKACKPSSQRHILDLTAGFGRDAALLSAFGAHLTLIERDPIMQVLLSDGIKRTIGTPEEGKIVLIAGEATAYLESLSPSFYPDVIYIDPMHPARQKSAKVKKLMQSLQTWIEPNLDVATLIMLSRKRVLERVVVKWPSRLPALLEPNHSIKGKTVRFDVYLPILSS